MLGSLSQRNTKVAVHQTRLVLNHYHTEVTSTEANLPDFKRLLHGESSKALMARERYDQPRQVWDDRATHSMRLLDAEAQAAHMIYGHARAEHLGRIPPELGPSPVPRDALRMDEREPTGVVGPLHRSQWLVDDDNAAADIGL